MIVDFSNRDLYNHNFIPYLHSDKRYNFYMGSAGSGKSVFVSQKEIIKTYENNNRLLCVRKVMATVKDSCYAELKQRISEWGLEAHFEINKSPLYIRNKLTGSDIIFRGMDNPEKIKSVQGVNRIWIEEATELNKNDFDQLDLRLRGLKDIQLTCAFNPVDAEHWLNTDFWELGNTDEVDLVHSTYLDNRFVGEQYKKVMARLKIQNPEYYKIYALGQWGTLQGLIFNNRSPIDDVPKEAKFLCYGKDFGYTNDPTTLIGIYQYNDEIILDELIYETNLTNQDIVERYKYLGLKSNDTIWADSAEPKSIEEIHKGGFNIKPVKKGPDSILFGIDLMKQYNIRITGRSTNTLKEFKKYVWQTDKNDKPINKPIDDFNHAIDAIRYGMMMMFKKKKFTFTNLSD